MRWIGGGQSGPRDLCKSVSTATAALLRCEESAASDTHVKLLTQSDYARHRKVSRQRVSQLVRAGRIELIGGRIDVARADTSLELNPIRSTRRRKPNPQPSPKAVNVAVNEWFYVCDRCSMTIPMSPATPLPAEISCQSCGADISVVDLLELTGKVKER